MLRWLPLPALVVAALACSAGEDPPPPAPVPAPVAAPEPAPEPRPAKAKRKAKAGKRREAGGAFPADVVDAYVEDCAHVFAPDVEGWDPEVDDDECTWREVDQNCSPDPFGCWDGGQTCLDGCGAPCAACQSTCAASCEDCKAACDGKGPGCVRGCAEARAGCREGCLDAREGCTTRCGAAEQECYAGAKKKVTRKCPDCAALGACQSDRAVEGKDPEACLKKFPGNDQDCLSWCWAQ